MSTCCPEDYFGSNPAIIKWNIVRGDTAKLRVQFFENDETTLFSTTGWEYAASAYSVKWDVLDELEVEIGNGYVDIVAPSDITAEWGSGSASIVAELAFDLEITIGDTVWTPIVGNINVIGDVSGGSL